MHKQLILAAVSWIDNLALSVQTVCVSSWTLSVQFFVLGPWMNNTFFLVGPGCTNCLFEQLGSGCTSTILLSHWALDVPIVYFMSWVLDAHIYFVFLTSTWNKLLYYLSWWALDVQYFYLIGPWMSQLFILSAGFRIHREQVTAFSYLTVILPRLYSPACRDLNC